MLTGVESRWEFEIAAKPQGNADIFDASARKVIPERTLVTV